MNKKLIITTFLIIGLNIHALAADTSLLPVAVEKKMQDLGLKANNLSLVITPLSGHNLPATKTNEVLESIHTRLQQADSTAQFNRINTQHKKLQSTINAPALQPLPIVSQNSHVPRTPASTMKLIPTFIALDVLGKDFVWQTDVFYSGYFIGNTLYGDLIIRGGGDPKLTHQHVENMLYRVQKIGIKHIEGNIVLDGSVFKEVGKNPAHFDNEPLRPYNASPDGMLMNFNTITIDSYPLDKYSSQANNSNQSLLEYTPTLSDINFPSRINIRSGHCSSNISYSLSPTWQKNQLKFSKNIPNKCQRHTFYIAYPNPREYAQKLVKAKWLKIGNTLSGEVKDGIAIKNSSPIAAVSHISSPLSQHIYDINHHSNNVMTEQLTLSIPIYNNHKYRPINQQTFSDYTIALSSINKWWQDNLTSQPPKMTNGSGLCRKCTVTAHNLNELLSHAYEHPHFSEYVNSLGIAGVSGTIKTHRYRKPDSGAIGRAWIKTGTLGNVTAMAGYIRGKSGQEYSVVSIINLDKGQQNANTYRPVLDEIINWVALH